MGLDLWFREDIARILISTHESMRRGQAAISPLDPEAKRMYQQGFSDAIQAVALAFGIVPRRDNRLYLEGPCEVEGPEW